MSENAVPVAVDTLIVGATIVTMDAERRILTDGALAICGDRIAAVGKRSDIEGAVTATQIVDGRDFLMTPGLVNAHIHVSGEALTRGYVPDDSGFMENVFEWLTPLYYAHSPEEQRLSAQLCAAEMLRNGITSFLEAGTILALDPVVEGLREIGIRGRVGQWIQDRAFDPAQDQNALIDEALRKLDDQMMRYPNSADAMICAWPSLVGHQTNTDEVWHFARDLAKRHGAGISAHMSPADVDTAWYVANTGRHPIEYLADIGVLGPHLSLTHVVHTTESEVALLGEFGVSVAHCPMSALKGAYGASAVGRFPEMDQSGANLALGTDAGNNGNAADLMRAMFVCAGLFKDARRDPKLFPAHRVLEMATLGGARAMQLADTIGSLEVGKKADLVLHDLQRPEWQPLLNIVNQLAYSADGRSVHSVWVDGRRVVENYRVTTLDETRLYRDAMEAARRITARSGLPDKQVWPVL